jgi:hypothetical protein
VFDRPRSGRHLFEEIIRENLDLGRPEQVSLIFERRITKRTPGRFRTRVITQGVIPSPHISFAANRRVLEVELMSQDCQLGEVLFDQVNHPLVIDGQRASALAFGDRRVMALLQALCLFILLPDRFRNATLHQNVAELMGETSERYGPGRMNYDLPRLCLHGLIERIPTYRPRAHPR